MPCQAPSLIPRGAKGCRERKNEQKPQELASNILPVSGSTCCFGADESECGAKEGSPEVHWGLGPKWSNLEQWLEMPLGKNLRWQQFPEERVGSMPEKW